MNCFFYSYVCLESVRGVQPMAQGLHLAQDGCEGGPTQNSTSSFAHQLLLVFVYLMCGPRQLFFFQRGPEIPKGWTPLGAYTGLLHSHLAGIVDTALCRPGFSSGFTGLSPLSCWGCSPLRLQCPSPLRYLKSVPLAKDMPLPRASYIQ